MLNKSRLENLSDGLFAIVLTLLVFDIKIPVAPEVVSNAFVWNVLGQMLPTLIEFSLSFLVLTMFWVSHNYFYAYFAQNVNRQIVLLNLLYLAFISLIPFSAHLLGAYIQTPLAITIYGLNILLISLVNITLSLYAYRSDEIDTHTVSRRLLKQSRIRSFLTTASTLLGMICAWIYIPLALVLYITPIVFNVIPGTLDAAEKLLGISLD